jgi:ATP-binding cassette subfamily F protein 3
MYSVSGLSISFSGIEIFDSISFLINARDRIGLVGKNGVGKSTLLRILAGLQEAEKGSFTYPAQKRIAYLPQELRIESQKTVYDETLAAFDEVNRLNDDIEKLNKQIESMTDFESDKYYTLLDTLNDKNERLQLLDHEKNAGMIERILKGWDLTQVIFSDLSLNSVEAGR